VTPRELVMRHLAERRPADAEETYKSRLRALDLFLGFLGREGRGLSRDDVLAYMRHVLTRVTPKGQPWSERTVEGALLGVRTLLKWAERRGLILESLSSWIKLARSAPLPRALSEEDAARLIEEGPRPGPLCARDRAIIELLYGTGLRASEVCRLDLVDVALCESLLLVRCGKGRKDRVVPFGERVRTALLAYLREERAQAPGPFFLSKCGTRLTRTGLGEVLRRAKTRAGLTAPASAHCLRHSFATHLLRHGADIVSLKALLGHAGLNATQVYLDLDVLDLARMIEKSHPRERGMPDTGL
jgi:integrase/recombinase XerD